MIGNYNSSVLIFNLEWRIDNEILVFQMYLFKLSIKIYFF